MLRLKLCVPVVVALALAAPPLAAAPVTVRLATLVPQNSLWHNALTDMGAAWMKSTDARVKLTIYAGGTQGDERTVIRLMRPEVDQLNAALLTAPGMTDIDDAFNVFSIPFFFESEAEQRHVREALTPMLSKRLEAKGYHLVSWGNAGWIQLFSKAPIRTPADLKRVRLFTSDGDERMVQWYTRNGFQPRALKSTDIGPSLMNGIIEAAPFPAYGAAVVQLHRSVDYMLDVRVAPLIGGTIITSRIWNHISPDDRAKVVSAGQVMEKRLDAEVPGQDAKAVGDMKARNKKFAVITLDKADLDAFRAEAERLAETMRGSMVPADIYDLALSERDAFRKAKR
jgi:TRAP-type C4-dicarboxylate transport system substrate-binding protein